MHPHGCIVALCIPNGLWKGFVRVHERQCALFSCTRGGLRDRVWSRRSAPPQKRRAREGKHADLLTENKAGDAFFESPVLNSPYEAPGRYWELDADGRPTGNILDGRRRAAYITPIARARRDSGTSALQGVLDLGIKAGHDEQRYDQYDLINDVRNEVAKWRGFPEPNWSVTPETAKLLKHWRSGRFQNQRPFFCQVEAAEIYIWLTEVAPRTEVGRRILAFIASGNEDANPGIERVALKLATGAGKTTVMAMIIAWQTINAVRSPSSRKFTNAFIVVSPGLTIRDRLRVLKPNDPDEYYLHREIIPQEFAHDIKKARIVVTNYHAFKPRELLEVASGTRALLEGRHGQNEFATTESPGQMLQRVMKELMGAKRILVINDEAHHCYREKPMTEEERKAKLEREEMDEIAERKEMARVWISGIEAIARRGHLQPADGQGDVQRGEGHRLLVRRHGVQRGELLRPPCLLPWPERPLPGVARHAQG